MNIPETDKWFIHWVVKSLDYRYRDLIPLLHHLGIEIYTDENGTEYISKTEFRSMLHSID